MTFTHMQIATAVALIVGYFAAHAAGLLTKAHAPQWVLGVVTTVLAALAGVIPTVVWNDRDSWKTYVANVFAALFAATMAHRSQVPEALQVATHNVGIGPSAAHGHRHGAGA
jgi:tryptophan-rich sensory protein